MTSSPKSREKRPKRAAAARSLTACVSYSQHRVPSCDWLPISSPAEMLRHCSGSTSKYGLLRGQEAVHLPADREGPTVQSAEPGHHNYPAGLVLPEHCVWRLLLYVNDLCFGTRGTSLRSSRIRFERYRYRSQFHVSSWLESGVCIESTWRTVCGSGLRPKNDSHHQTRSRARLRQLRGALCRRQAVSVFLLG